MARRKYKTYISNKQILNGPDIEEKKEEQKAIFETFSIHYNVEGITQIEKKRNLDRQKYLYDGLCDKGLDNTAVEKLLDIATQEFQTQESVKQVIDNKVGFALAFWGIILGFVIQGEILVDIIDMIKALKDSIIMGTIAIILLSGFILLSILILWDVHKSLSPKEWIYIDIADKDFETYRVAVDDENMAYVVMLECIVNALINNRNTNDDKADVLQSLVLKSSFYSVLVIIMAVVVAI